jgi:hypothetical protein
LTERGTDIEFDFFDDEPETEEATQRRRLPRGGPPRGPRRPRPPQAPTNVAGLLRLVGAIAVAILIVVGLVFWVQSCRGAGKRHSYETYMAKVRGIATTSQQTGRELNDLLTTPGEKPKSIEAKLRNFAQQEQQNLTQAQAIAAPGPLRPEQQHVIEALQFRVSGLRGLADAFRQTAATKDSSGAGKVLSDQARRLVASDVIWDDLFKDPSRAELDRQGITGLDVADSDFLSNPDLVSIRSMSEIVQRIRGATTGGTPTGLHGTGLVSVRALPEGITLQPGTDNKVTASTDLAFEVTVQDTGDNQEVRIPVTLTIEKSPQPLVKRLIIDLIDPGTTKTLTFRGLDVTGALGLKSTVKVEVGKVPGETRTSNNVGTYPVFFSIG